MNQASHECATSLAAVFQRYAPEYQPRQIHELCETGGFSGARLWRVDAGAGPLCLRRWPAGQPDAGRLQFIHAVLKHVQQNGFERVPVPLPDRRNDSLVVVDGACWELTRWLPGIANYQAEPHQQKLINAFETLARFHQAAATFPESPARRGASPKIQQRGNQLRELQSGGVETIADALRTADHALKRRGARLVDLFRYAAPTVSLSREAAKLREVRLQPCICDIWHDHVLFTGVHVTGLIDFGAMHIDTVACDIARLLGSLAGDQLPERTIAIEAYSALARMSDDERTLVEVFDQSSVLLSGMNWLQWLCVDEKRFTNPERVLTRMDGIIQRLENQTCSRGLTLS